MTGLAVGFFGWFQLKILQSHANSWIMLCLVLGYASPMMTAK
uniref:Uncharacterized protein n=1 Tax=Arundo donax TaxID=35708 RepID=A0A0A9GTS7_ARUDO